MGETVDPESLEKLISLFAQLGADAKWAFIAYLALQAFKIIAIAGTVITLAVMILKVIRQCCADTQAYNALRALFGLDWFEHDKLVRRVTELAAAEKKS